MSTFDALLLIAEAAALLFLLWRILDLTFDAIGQWQKSLRHEQAERAGTLEDAQAPRRAEH